MAQKKKLLYNMFTVSINNCGSLIQVANLSYHLYNIASRELHYSYFSCAQSLINEHLKRGQKEERLTVLF